MMTVTSRASEGERPIFWLSFAAHLAASLAMVVVVRNVFEGGDMLAYHRVGVILADQFRAEPWDTAGMWFDLLIQTGEPLPIPGVLPGSSTGSMQAISAVLAVLLNGSLFASVLAIAIATFFGKLAIYGVLRRELPTLPERALGVACLLMPSVVFWSSGILKEPIAIIGLGCLLSGVYGLARGELTVRNLLLAVCGYLLISLTKPHVLPPFAAGAAAWLVIRRQQATGRIPTTRALVIGGTFALVAVFAIGVFFQRYAPDQLAEEMARMQEVGAQTAGGSQYTLNASPTSSLQGQLLLVPFALATALFRPVVFEARSFLVALNSLEVAVLTWMFASAAFRHRLVGIVPKIAASPGLAFCALFVVGFGVGVGLTTTNLGTLSRYRMPLVPFFTVLLVALGERQSLSAPLGQAALLAPRRAA